MSEYEWSLEWDNMVCYPEDSIGTVLCIERDNATSTWIHTVYHNIETVWILSEIPTLQQAIFFAEQFHMFSLVFDLYDE